MIARCLFKCKVGDEIKLSAYKGDIFVRKIDGFSFHEGYGGYPDGMYPFWLSPISKNKNVIFPPELGFTILALIKKH